ncbi:MAG: hypothetical protein U5Q44_03455 [Dehalococcoidia bacterium]|nr:hypothetical protein [Dehalococcoidia bacterium]
MRRPIASTLAAAAIIAGLALQGGAALAQETLDPLCLDYATDDRRLLLRESSMVVLGEVEAGQDDNEVRIVPERFLKGANVPGSFGLERMEDSGVLACRARGWPACAPHPWKRGRFPCAGRPHPRRLCFGMEAPSSCPAS